MRPLTRQLALLTLFLATASPAAVALAQNGSGPLPARRPAPPAEPRVKPVIASLGPADLDSDRIDDALGRRLAAARRLEAPDDRASALAERVRLELVFAKQVTQAQIDAFLAMGGEIDHVYRSVSYGWNGSIPLEEAERLPAEMGTSLAAVVAAREAQLHLGEATQTGRVRPAWVPGFAGSGSGFAGGDDITIAILDTGVDDSHADLAGRSEYWMDYTTDAEASPRDIGQHGSHVAGIALGTGASIGASPTQVLYTDSGNLSGVPAGSFYPSPIHIPPGAATLQSTAVWFDGGPAGTLHALRQPDGGGSYASHGNASGSSPLTNTRSFTALAGYNYAAALLSNGSITRYAVANTATYSGAGDGYNALSGVAPSSRWAGAKVFTNAGTGSSLDIEEALDDLVTQRVAHSIKVANMSLGITGNPGISTTLRAKVNTMVNNGIVAVTSAGNDGPGTAAANLVDDPGRAALALTVAASNSVNALTRYTSSGFLSPGADEDNKPDLMAPGGSQYYQMVLSVDSNDADAESAAFPDQRTDDYYNIMGTSMAAPFAAGAAALVIDALQQSGVAWDFTSSAHPLLVKMLLCATATESNAAREASSGSDPTLGRAATPKDRFEGYGLINPDAAIEAVMLPYSPTGTSGSTDGGCFDRRAWARHARLTAGSSARLDLTVPPTADFDLYLYSGAPDAKGNPVILASSAVAGLGVDEAIDFTASVSETAYLVVKRVSGSGAWTLEGPTLVELVSFGATARGDHVEVTWQTAAELDAAGFHLWRGETEGGGYLRVTETLIPAAGGVTLGASYRFEDRAPLPGGGFYRLEDVDLSGASTFHGPVPVLPATMTLLAPSDGARVRADSPPFFSWERGPYDRFALQFSRTADFSGAVLSLPASSWITGASYRPRSGQWRRVTRLAGPTGRLFWRVSGVDAAGSGHPSRAGAMRIRRALSLGTD